MTRAYYIERILRQIYGGYVRDDSTITTNLVNGWLNDAIAYAAKQNYKEAIALEGIGYVNNGFYSTFKGIPVVEDERFTWKIELPQIPLGIGRNEGISTLKFKSSDGQISLPCIPVTEAQASYFQTMRPLEGKVIYKYENSSAYAYTPIDLSGYTAQVTMVSGGDSSDLTSKINVPDDYFPFVTDYIQKQLMIERSQPQDTANDGADIK